MAVKKSRKKMTIITIMFTITCFITLCHHLYHYTNQTTRIFLSPPSSLPPISALHSNSSDQISAVRIPPPKILQPSTSTLIPDWEVLVIVTSKTVIPSSDNGTNYVCVFRNNEMTIARFRGELHFNGGYAFKCEFPIRSRRRLPFLQPVVVEKVEGEKLEFRQFLETPFEMVRWNFVVYDCFTTENDVVLFVKGVNNRQGVNRSPSDFRCVFGKDQNVVRTKVTSSVQEVFRCVRPENVGGGEVGVSVEIVEGDRTVVVMPSLARYVHEAPRTVMQVEGKARICACTMVHNVGKFLREWVMFHSKIGVEKFVLYDNDSEDDLLGQVDGLRRDGFDVRVVYWVWPKAQEAGFSHCALYSARICDWAAYVDVDEFFFSPMWLDSDWPSADMLRSLVPAEPEVKRVGQVSIRCNEFGPSGQMVHPIQGVTQGYTCRRRWDQRHKSIVYLPAVDHSLLNVVHHFQVRDGYKSVKIKMERAIVNHYKYQAWPEFRAKFRRRVSAYVIDWRQNLNPKSNDRAPGLGFEPIEPIGWAQKFCEVRDERLQMLTRKWFGVNDQSTMAWQST